METQQTHIATYYVYNNIWQRILPWSHIYEFTSFYSRVCRLLWLNAAFVLPQESSISEPNLI